MKGEATYRYLLKRYLNNSETEEELHQLYALTTTGIYDALLNSAVMESWNQSRNYTSWNLQSDSRKRYLNNYFKKFIRENQTGLFHKLQMSYYGNYRWLAYALVSMVLVIFSIGFWWQISQSANAAADVVIPTMVYTNTSGFHKLITLDDGTEVKLTPQSSLRYSSGKKDGPRLAILKGSAHFYVKETIDKRKFIVQLRSLKTEVLGTSFSVESLEKSSTIMVTVQSGKVRVSGKKENKAFWGKRDDGQIIVSPNQRVDYHENSGSMVLGLSHTILPIGTKDKTNALVLLDFKEGITLGKLTDKLQQIFGVTIKCEDSKLLNCTMHGNFTGQELLKVIDIICLSVNASYVIENAGIIIKNGYCN
jgi:hypothetical protein